MDASEDKADGRPEQGLSTNDSPDSEKRPFERLI
jgi:hypothetical protein